MATFISNPSVNYVGLRRKICWVPQQILTLFDTSSLHVHYDCGVIKIQKRSRDQGDQEIKADLEDPLGSGK